MFQISAHGSRAGVINKVKAAEGKPEQRVDAGQLAAVKVFVVSEIEALPTEYNGVRVDVQGDAHAGGRTLQVTIQPLKLEL